jgi:hypothetical protein
MLMVFMSISLGSNASTQQHHGLLAQNVRILGAVCASEPKTHFKRSMSRVAVTFVRNCARTHT